MKSTSMKSLKFVVSCSVQIGEEILLIGDNPSLGNWNSHNGLQLSTKDNSSWTVDIPDGLPLSPSQVEFKFVKRRGDEIIWEDGANRVVNIPRLFTNCTVVCGDWGTTSCQIVSVVEQEGSILEVPCDAMFLSQNNCLWWGTSGIQPVLGKMLGNHGLQKIKSDYKAHLKGTKFVLAEIGDVIVTEVSESSTEVKAEAIYTVPTIRYESSGHDGGLSKYGSLTTLGDLVICVKAFLTRAVEEGCEVVAIPDVFGTLNMEFDDVDSVPQTVKQAVNDWINANHSDNLRTVHIVSYKEA